MQLSKESIDLLTKPPAPRDSAVPPLPSEIATTNPPLKAPPPRGSANPTLLSPKGAPSTRLERARARTEPQPELEDDGIPVTVDEPEEIAEPLNGSPDPKRPPPRGIASKDDPRGIGNERAAPIEIVAPVHPVPPREDLPRVVVADPGDLRSSADRASAPGPDPLARTQLSDSGNVHPLNVLATAPMGGAPQANPERMLALTEPMGLEAPNIPDPSQQGPRTLELKNHRPPVLEPFPLAKPQATMSAQRGLLLGFAAGIAVAIVMAIVYLFFLRR
jgi:hypothetical protein